MKKILWVLLLALFVGSVQAAPVAVTSGQAAMGKSGQAVITAESFLQAVRDGEISKIIQINDASLLTAQDEYKHNVFHLAKNMATLQAVAAVARRLQPDTYLTLFKTLRNQRDDIDATPLMHHIRLGKTDTFEALYRGSDLQEAIRVANSVNGKGEVLVNVANVKTQLARREGSDVSKQTVADVAKDKGLQNIVTFFERRAPYMFTK